MPLYEYACPEGCFPTFEKIVSLEDREVFQECPACGSLCARARLYPTPFFMIGFSGSRARPEHDWNPKT